MSKKKRQEHHEEHVDESWLIPYSDLLTLLLALFIVMYAMSSADAQKFQQMSNAFGIAFNNSGLSSSSSGGGNNILYYNASQPQGGSNPDAMSEAHNSETETADNVSRRPNAEQAAIEQKQLEELKEKADQYIEKNGLSAQLNTQLNMSELKITIKDSALFASGKAELMGQSEELALAIGDLLKSYPGYQIVISGHTDNVPIKSSNFESNWDLSSARALNFMKVVLERSGLDPKQFQAVGMGEYHPIASNDTNAGKAQNRRVEVSILRKYTNNTVNEISP